MGEIKREDKIKKREKAGRLGLVDNSPVLQPVDQYDADGQAVTTLIAAHTNQETWAEADLLRFSQQSLFAGSSFRHQANAFGKLSYVKLTHRIR